MYVNLLMGIDAFESRDGRGQDFPVLGFATTSRADDHKTVSDLDSIVQLNNLGHKSIDWLEVLLFASLDDLWHEVTVGLLRTRHTWE